MAYRFEGIVGESPCTPAEVSRFLEANPDHAEMNINSPGGIATDGAAILAEVQAHGNVTVRIRGLAASAASLVAVGGKHIVMAKSALMMIHDPSGMTLGTAGDHRETADMLDKMADTYARAYAAASANPVELVAGWMAAETWMNAEDALALRFIDEIEKSPEPAASAAFDVTMFRNPPDHLLRQWRAIEQKGAGNAA